MLVAQGMSHRAIAEATSLSVRTVEDHIYLATAKAGVASRAKSSSVIKQLNQAAAAVPRS